MSNDFDEISRAIGRLEGTITQQHETTRASIAKLFECTDELDKNGCSMGKQMDKRLSMTEKKVYAIGLVLASLMGVGKLADWLIG
jgi:hypothetical protein